MDDREKLVELLHKEVRCPGTVTKCEDGCPYFSVTVPCDEFAATADMLIAHGVTVKEPGYWQLCKDDSSDNRTRYWRCSVCKGYRFHNGEMRKKYKYCPNCGNPMNGDKQ